MAKGLSENLRAPPQDRTVLERALFGNDGIAVFVGGCTAAEEAEWAAARVPELVLLPRANGDGVAG